MNQLDLPLDLDLPPKLGASNQVSEQIRPHAGAGRTARRSPLPALAAVALGLGGLGVTAATSNQQFARGLEQALQSGNPAATPLAAPQNRAQPPVSGSEAYWLNSGTLAVPVRPAAWTGRALAAGDRFTFGGDADRRILEVTDVRQLDAGAAAAANAGKASAAMLLVTLRDTAARDGALVRLLVEADAPIAGLTPLGNAPQSDL